TRTPTGVVTPGASQTPTRTPTLVPTATPGPGTPTAVPTPTRSPLSAGLHEDDDSGIAYSAGWTVADGAHQATSAGRTATFAVGGNVVSVTVWYLANSGGSLEVFEDGTLRGSVAEGAAAGHI